MADLAGKLRIMGAWFESDGWIANAAIANGGADEITSLRSDLERTKDRIAAHKDENIALNINVLQLRANLERARKALEPFAKLAAVAHPDHRDTRPFIFAFDTAVAQRLTIGDLRAARAALAEIAH